MINKLKADAMVWQMVDGEIVCLDLATSTYLSVNASGTALWQLLLDGAEHHALVQELQSTFDIPHERASADVKEFLAELRERGLLQVG